jgi:hypothetical protein
MITFKKVIRGLAWAVALVLAFVVIRQVNRPGPRPPMEVPNPSPDVATSTTPAPSPSPAGESPQPTSEQVTPPQTTGRPPITGHPPLSMQKPKLDLNACEYFAKRGDYEEAVVCYRERQKLDPSNDSIRQRIEHIIKSCKEENEILQINLNCDPKPGAKPSAANSPKNR